MVKKIGSFWKIFILVIVIIGSIYIFYSYKKAGSDSPNIDQFDMVHINLVHRNYANFSRYYIKDYMQLLKDENFSFDRKTLIYVHGWIEDFYSESSQVIINAYVSRGDHNIVFLDWGQYSFGEYYTVIPRFTKIAKLMGKILHEWVGKGLDINKVHCVGHSFGSHIMGIMGRELKKLSNGNLIIKRISGLDPAHYGFFPTPVLDGPLSSSDAEFVDAIHSDVNFIGTNYRVGHVDFYPNNGYLQPGCPPFRFKNYMQLINSFCSHHHGWRYWAETVPKGREKTFPAVLCGNYKDFTNGKCNENPINFMGYGAMSSSPGVYYNELRSNVNFTVDDSYYLYLATSLKYRSDLMHIVSKLWQFFNSTKTLKTSRDKKLSLFS